MTQDPNETQNRLQAELAKIRQARQNGPEFSILSHRLYENGKLSRFIPTPNRSEKEKAFQPQGIILHDTASRLTKGSAVKWFQNPQAKASAHFIIERDGAVIQMVPLNQRAWHAGKSQWQQRDGVNAFAFGIELVNVGKCQQQPDGRMKAWFGTTYANHKNGLTFWEHETKQHGKGWWLDYTDAQIAAVTSLCHALTEHYQLTFLAPHWEISPGRKIDTNPLFPLEALRQSLAVKHQHNQQDRFELAMATQAPIRRWPSLNDNIITHLAPQTKLRSIRSGLYENQDGQERRWLLVRTPSYEGWVQEDHTVTLH